ncbi:MAG: long-chain-fatty-acid--CoA ligase [Acidobacteriia bacterium]|nr:long-chain-fatty-acid--CoA ligase [Terriglobia bacterium]
MPVISPSVNYAPLSPLQFLERSLLVYPNKPAVVYGQAVYTYAQYNDRICRLGEALRALGIGRGDRVAIMAPNIPPMLDAKFGPMRIGAILVPLNIRLSSREIAYILNHSGAKVLIFDSEFADTVRELRQDVSSTMAYVQIVDTAPKAVDIPGPEYEEFLDAAPPRPGPAAEIDESGPICINYTSGTTGFPKGVVFHARGAWINAVGEVIETGMNWRSVYLWTLPLFHCNGWCFPWGIVAIGATSVCLRKVVPADIFRLINRWGVTHMCCAPTVLTALYSSPDAAGQDLSGVTIATAGAPPAPQVIRTMERMGAQIHHLYGLTETYGPYTVCADQPGWSDLDPEQRALVKARQGVPYGVAGAGLRVVDEDMQDIPRDGQTMGEVVMRGNMVMTEYYEDTEATAAAFRGGWFHSGDLAVWHPDGYVELKDRSKDIIISGAENISSQEVEKVVMEHPDVLEVCVVGVPDDKWGEVPKAFVVRRPGSEVSAAAVIEFTRARLAHFKCPKHVEFGDLPKTATGKIQKFVLRDREWQGSGRRIKG